MGFFLILLVIGSFLLGGSLVLGEKIETMRGQHEGLGIISIMGIVVGIIMLCFSAMFFLFAGLDNLYTNVNMEKYLNERGKLVRLLNEDYNAENLSSALDFNVKQKLYKFKESGFMWSHFNTDGIYVDTIAIPTGKFMPSQKIKISSDSTGQ